MNWTERIEAFRRPSERLDSYGNYRCGCTWDSGPYGVYCERHDGEGLQWDLFKALLEMVERGERDEELIAAARAFVEDPEDGHK